MPEEAQVDPQEQKKPKGKGKKKDEALDLVGAVSEDPKDATAPGAENSEPSETVPDESTAVDAAVSETETDDPKSVQSADSPDPAQSSEATTPTCDGEQDVTATDSIALSNEPSIEEKLVDYKHERLHDEIAGLMQFISQRLPEHMRIARQNGHHTIAVSLGSILATANNAQRNIGDTEYWKPKAKR